jgi:hypothetical protein
MTCMHMSLMTCMHMMMQGIIFEVRTFPAQLNTGGSFNVTGFPSDTTCTVRGCYSLEVLFGDNFLIRDSSCTSMSNDKIAIPCLVVWYVKFLLRGTTHRAS